MSFSTVARWFRERVGRIEYRVATVFAAAGVVPLGVIVCFLACFFSTYHLSPPQRLQAEPTRDGTVLLTWSAPLYDASRLQAWEYQCAKEREQFRAWRRAENTASDRRLDLRSCGDRKLKSGRPYKFRVQAVFKSAGADEKTNRTWPSNVARATPKIEVNRTVVWLRKLYNALNQVAHELAKSLEENTADTEQILNDVEKGNQRLSEILNRVTATDITLPETNITIVLQRLTKLIADLNNGRPDLAPRLTELMRILKRIEVKINSRNRRQFSPSCSREYIGNLYFPHDSWQFPTASQPTNCNACTSNEDTLMQIEARLKNSQGAILVEGYASPPGSYGYNLNLAHERTLYVIERLLKKNGDWRMRFKPVVKGEGYFPDLPLPEERYRKVRVSVCSDKSAVPPVSFSPKQ